MDEWNLYLSLFFSFFKIGLFGFGGGYAMLSLIQHEVVETHQWISVSDFTDIVAISQTTPGPIAFNTATYIGYTATGNVWGGCRVYAGRQFTVDYFDDSGSPLLFCLPE